MVFRAESFLLRAQRPELAVKFYRDAGMWQDVLRVAKEYLPHKLPQLQDEYEREMMEKSTKLVSVLWDSILSSVIPIYSLLPPLFSFRGAETLVQQAREWESSGEYLRAIECYVKVDRQQTNDQNVMHKCWMKVRSQNYFIVHTILWCARILAIHHVFIFRLVNWLWSFYHLRKRWGWCSTWLQCLLASTSTIM